MLSELGALQHGWLLVRRSELTKVSSGFLGRLRLVTRSVQEGEDGRTGSDQGFGCFGDDELIWNQNPFSHRDPEPASFVRVWTFPWFPQACVTV